MFIDQSIDNTWICQKRPVIENDVLIQIGPAGSGVYSGKSDCLVLPKNKSFYGKTGKNSPVLE